MSAALISRADSVINDVLNAVAHAQEDIVVKSPPGAGKTRLLEDISALCVMHLQKTVMIACPSNDQADDVTARIAKAFPQIAVDRFVASSGGVPASLAGLANVTVVSDTQRLTAPVTIGTVAKFCEIDGLPFDRDFALYDEAYQVKNVDMLRTGQLAHRRIAIGDPGQIDPITRSSTRHFARDPQGPHVAAPKAMLAANTARAFHLPLSRRLPQDTVDVVQPAFYPGHTFDGVAAAGQRYIDASAHGATPADRLLDRALAAGSLSMIALPAGIMPVVDPEIVDLVAELVRRLTTRRFMVHDDDGSALLRPEDIGVVAFRRHQVSALRGALGNAFSAVNIETANRFQGLERKVIVSLHPLSGKARLDRFSTEGGRLCVAASRHRVNCIVVTRVGVTETLDRFAPDDGRYLGQTEDPYFDGWMAHATFMIKLEDRNRVIRP
ncbi:AAA domain-containing protein [Methylobacterium nonmethylotrophicum]|uniref:DNA2/NAM7 helicase-like C-terminal domain-containing protein n=1 Tax=Methylobacterium nonmethylotrophicum TaxID=1141884 RepID=A0A4Z0NYA3_9HYPH|nr:AAA domain-containing protein [Methylobacterium nonmethylotrophicum]TGE02441.1 hypothetical protein EU555_01340 [Methylobacterium nonmethylotrophicum]